MNRKDTNSRFRPEDSGDARQLVRFKMSATLTDYGASQPRRDVVKAHRYNGNDEGTIDYIVAINGAMAAGDEFWAMMPDGGTGVTYAKDAAHAEVPILWLQVATLDRPAKFRLMSKTGSFPAWSYTCQRVIGYDSTATGAARWITDGVDLTFLNRCEFAPPAGTYPYTYGTGNTITASDGTVNGTACKIVPIGVGAVVDGAADFDQTGAVILSFFSANSAE